MPELEGSGLEGSELADSGLVDPGAEGDRLQKVMAAAGVASRRASEDLIAQGRVAVNGTVVTEPGRRVAARDTVSVDGTVIQRDPTKRYIMLNKPLGFVSSLADESGRPDLTEFVRRYDERLFNVGRLDAQTTGLLLLTNDGDLAHRLAHPSFGVTKTYIAKVAGSVSPQTIVALRRGVELDDGQIVADGARILSASSAGSTVETMLEVSLHSGRNRIVRRMLAAVGHPVVALVRRRFGPLTLGTLPVGETRELTRGEVGELLTMVHESAGSSRDGSAGGDAGGVDDE